MEGISHIALPVLGIVAVSVVTFYAVSFAEIREKSFKDVYDSENEVGFKTSLSSRERRSKREANKKRPKS
ncbi:hypothetical protein AtNW77_Chr3g0181421 [Arabidopsis thaliana]|jgi:uncharacterized protein (DUF697 family)|uniref:At3g22210 n=4 Tax=Arabidopsis TaxID=3701 RepID=Q8LA01_ARATH|nr:uncharacterized protein AT3G22210 [Arabidopsis thaliana]KAG7626171.1 hypothetical protein ISN45_At03g023380 [Arabidopsis thaliana x Arabidopsis arenosa]KAG7632164.1 hypothetical protein ISN44_As03g023170 [Arabidopsis suecica]AAM65661.1 unknown [Arabidopsis thaliana]ABD38862.1 At3g22210 [Arabidopsis thaliana]AEE76604.1 transmembrane protein [Arabidopsis thaliana]|eukprot:NP_566701.1 transmembrane protein [Arabidopsis thaliana]